MKKVVRYRKALDTPPKEGYGYVVYPIDHPACSNGGVPAQTSNVLKSFSGGFETDNTLYIEEKE